MVYDKKFFDLCKKLGSNIKKLREEKQISINELSKITGIRAEYIKKIEKGTAYGVLLYKHLAKIAKGLNVKLSDLFV